MKYIR